MSLQMAGTNGQGYKVSSGLNILSRKDGPCFLVALVYWKLGVPIQPDGAGLVMITDDAKGGLIDVHDSRPIVLSGPDALAWIDPDLTPRGASVLMHHGLPTEAFQWWGVGLAVGNAQNECKELIRNVATEQSADSCRRHANKANDASQ